ncbi:MAG: hypothetical protein RL186_857 [Pseudomonadota bacterium]
MGDPCGIGPEVTAKAWTALRENGPVFAVLGDKALYSGVPTQMIESPELAADVFKSALPILAGIEVEDAQPGQPDPRFAPAILASIRQAVACVTSGQASGLVTAPLAKSIVQAAGFAHPGHTEYLGALLQDTPYNRPRGPIMMLTIDGLRVVPVTIHMALRDVALALTIQAIVDACRVTADALRHDFEIAAPRIAVAALNPHAGEGGAFGDEEARIIAPAITILHAQGHDVTGPWPADSLFHAKARASHDAVICMYHDQALIPLKTLDFWGGVNVTLGLPIIRTSPDHGTGFDIAGKGIALPDSMIAAIQLAAQLGQRRPAS